MKKQSSLISKGRMVDPSLEIETVELGTAAGEVHAVKYEWKDGDVVRTASLDGKCFPLVEQDMYARQLCSFLNANIQFDKGATWRCVWTQPRSNFYNRMSRIWQRWVPELLECQYLDKDGDVLTVVDFEENVWDLLDNFSFTDVANLCQEAYESLRDLEKDVGIKESQKYSPAHGESEINPAEVIPDIL